MDRAYERSLGTALAAVGVGLLLFGFFQAYEYIQSPPTGTYNLVNGGGGRGNSSFNLTFNGRYVEVFSFLLVEYLVGGAILRAGWNLITPKAETIQVRVKPRSLQVEPVGFSAPPPSPLPPAGPVASPAPPGERP